MLSKLSSVALPSKRAIATWLPKASSMKRRLLGSGLMSRLASMTF